jgi:hypothetical protein
MVCWAYLTHAVMPVAVATTTSRQHPAHSISRHRVAAEPALAQSANLPSPAMPS